MINPLYFENRVQRLEVYFSVVSMQETMSELKFTWLLKFYIAIKPLQYVSTMQCAANKVTVQKTCRKYVL